MTTPQPVRIPILRLGDILLTGLLDDLDDTSAVVFTEELVERVAADQIRGVVVDVSRLRIIDSFVARVLTEMAGTGHLLGAQVIVAGIQPAVAITLAELGLQLTGVHTALNAEQAMARLGWQQTRPRRVQAGQHARP